MTMPSMPIRTAAVRLLADAGGLADTPARAMRPERRASMGSHTRSELPESVPAHASTISGSTIGTADSMPANDEAMAGRFREAVMPHLDDAYNLARYLTRNPQDAEDVVQDAYLRAYKFFGTFKGGNARAWLLAIVRNCFYTWVKAKPRSDTASLTDIDLDDVDIASVVSDLWTSDSVDPERSLIKLNDAAAVRTLIERLPMQFRETLVLREMEELSYQEIAEITEVPIGTVMSRLARARQLFKVAWMEHQDKERRS
jgi:RNA polymerase sigma-70 factor, ECF subfamily